MNKNKERKYLSNLHPSERKAYNYLIKKGINIPLPILLKKEKGLPDFIDDKGIRYEVKRVILRNKNGLGYITFENTQINNFKDKDIILITYPFSNKPIKEITFEKIKNKINNKGIFYLSREDIVKYKCKKCNYNWYPRIKKLPKQCPNCKRYDWNKGKANG